MADTKGNESSGTKTGGPAGDGKQSSPQPNLPSKVEGAKSGGPRDNAPPKG
ncbi:hypothetical protein FHS01_003483 [Longimicrobium terrae]|uniref:Uncharacterized protein n=1 Tax=Longimicrobium terrae TaxID=1639882 RepID=A0A841H1H6_9BACT|nr:hypothetical protein [Longimicrobium terrae]MBB6071824.1 hypothetical protein [Longimicrobium terrae]